MCVNIHQGFITSYTYNRIMSPNTHIVAHGRVAGNLCTHDGSLALARTTASNILVISLYRIALKPFEAARVEEGARAEEVGEGAEGIDHDGLWD